VAETRVFELEPFFTFSGWFSIEEIFVNVGGFFFALMSGVGIVLGEVDFCGVD
jgi:hypothetical protein